MTTCWPWPWLSVSSQKAVGKAPETRTVLVRKDTSEGEKAVLRKLLHEGSAFNENLQAKVHALAMDRDTLLKGSEEKLAENSALVREKNSVIKQMTVLESKQHRLLSLVEEQRVELEELQSEKERAELNLVQVQQQAEADLETMRQQLEGLQRGKERAEQNMVQMQEQAAAELEAMRQQLEGLVARAWAEQVEAEERGRATGSHELSQRLQDSESRVEALTLTVAQLLEVLQAQQQQLEEAQKKEQQQQMSQQLVRLLQLQLEASQQETLALMCEYQALQQSESALQGEIVQLHAFNFQMAQDGQALRDCLELAQSQVTALVQLQYVVFEQQGSQHLLPTVLLAVGIPLSQQLLQLDPLARSALCGERGGVSLLRDPRTGEGLLQEVMQGLGNTLTGPNLLQETALSRALAQMELHEERAARKMRCCPVEGIEEAAAELEGMEALLSLPGGSKGREGELLSCSDVQAAGRRSRDQSA